MSAVYDNWERLVAATFKREKLRQSALCTSFSSSSDFSCDSSFQDIFAPLSLTNSSNRSARSMSFKEIRKATENFRWDLYLGEGAFGIVYKGWIHEDTLTAAKGFMSALSRSRIAVAVKKWKTDKYMSYLDPETTWSTEHKYLCQLDHPNVVKLIGYCSEGDNLVMVYELLRKGSMRYHLLAGWYQALSWDTRVKVAIGAARGLSFLHEREIPIIHRDFHVANILLDADFNAKLSGFGLAMDGPVGDASHISTDVVGTCGDLVAPEYMTAGHLTVKCDVFAFGVVLLQILSGCNYFDLWRTEPLMNDYKKLSLIMDTKLNGQYPRNGALAVMRLAFQCLNSDSKLRPRMDEVLVSLQKLQTPKNDW